MVAEEERPVEVGSPGEEEEKKLAEEKKKDYVEDEVQELIPVRNPNQIDEGRNQAGPSTVWPSTPRPEAQKGALRGSEEEPEGKRLKVTFEKNIHSLEQDAPEAKRLKQEEKVQEERRVEATEVEGRLYYHMDKVIEEDFLEWENE